MVVFVSRRSVKRPWVRKEIGLAIGKARPILPIVIDPPKGSHALTAALCRYQYLSLKPVAI